MPTVPSSEMAEELTKGRGDGRISMDDAGKLPNGEGWRQLHGREWTPAAPSDHDKFKWTDEADSGSALETNKGRTK